MRESDHGVNSLIHLFPFFLAFGLRKKIGLHR